MDIHFDVLFWQAYGHNNYERRKATGQRFTKVKIVTSSFTMLTDSHMSSIFIWD